MKSSIFVKIVIKGTGLVISLRQSPHGTWCCADWGLTSGFAALRSSVHSLTLLFHLSKRTASWGLVSLQTCGSDGDCRAQSVECLSGAISSGWCNSTLLSMPAQELLIYSSQFNNSAIDFAECSYLVSQSRKATKGLILSGQQRPPSYL